MMNLNVKRFKKKKEVQRCLHGPFDFKSSDDDRYHPAWKRILHVSNLFKDSTRLQVVNILVVYGNSTDRDE